uniref:Uncharacterized protein n=1 Tax=Lepeophtheirus salmonis TaxID=72036 RepID=A0A0K2ULH8_LEPSM
MIHAACVICIKHTEGLLSKRDLRISMKELWMEDENSHCSLLSP